jgi:hypothetical protein
VKAQTVISKVFFCGLNTLLISGVKTRGDFWELFSEKKNTSYEAGNTAYNLYRRELMPERTLSEDYVDIVGKTDNWREEPRMMTILLCFTSPSSHRKIRTVVLIMQLFCGAADPVSDNLSLFIPSP